MGVQLPPRAPQKKADMHDEIFLSKDDLALKGMLEDFVKKEVEPQASKFDRDEKFNLPLFKKLGNLGLLGLLINEKYGGSELSLSSMVLVHEELSKSDPGLTLSYLAHSVLCAYNLQVNASEEQKKRFLPPLSSGEKIGAMAMSEPDCGTDVLSMKTSAVKKGNKYILNGRKMWITNGCVDEEKTPCDLVLVYAKVKDKISSFVVEKGMPGFFVGQKIDDKLGMRASNTAELVFDNCEVKEENLIGKEGDSLVHMMRNLEVERLALASMSIGIAGRALKIMNRYASERQSFKKPIRSFGQVQRYIAQSYASLQSVRTYAYTVAKKMEENKDKNHRLECDAVKLLAGRLGKEISDNAIQVLGGYGYVGEYQVERLWRDAKLLEIGGGTNEALEKNITKELEKKEL